VFSSIPERDVDTRYMFPSSFNTFLIEHYLSISCISLTLNQLEVVANKVDKAKLTHLVVDGNAFEKGVILPWILQCNNLRSLRLI
jgi:hypothetical protein